METLNITFIGEQKTARKIMPCEATAEAKLLNVLDAEPLHVDELRNQSELSIEKVTAAVVLIALMGMVCQVGGINYVAVREAQSEDRVDWIITQAS